MKYLKKFEKIEQPKEIKVFGPKFKVGDYVVAQNVSYANIDMRKYVENTVTQIYSIINYDFYVKYENPPKEFWVFTDENGDLGDFFSENELRLATPEEIEDYKMKKTANNYNL